jgi:parallel beta-helix repeat protein
MLNNRNIIFGIVTICSALFLGALIYGTVNFQITFPNTPPSPLFTPIEPPKLAPIGSPFVPPADAVVVPDHYPTVQQAIEKVTEGGMVFVRAGIYNELVTVTKSLWLAGDDKATTIINGNSSAPTVLITHDNVNVTGFTVMNTPIPISNDLFAAMTQTGPTHLPGIQIVNAKNCIVSENILTGSQSGVYLSNTFQTNIIENEVVKNGNGIKIESSANNNIYNNKVTGGGCGIIVDSSADNIFVNNNVTNAIVGIQLNFASNNTLRNNNMVTAGQNFGVVGNDISTFVNDVDTSNTVYSKPIYYWISKYNEIVPSDAGCIILINCLNISIQNFSLAAKNHGGILLAYTNNSNINIDNFRMSAQDILVRNSFNNKITNSRANIYLTCSSYNEIAYNTGTMDLDYSNSNIITQNTILGLEISHSSNNRIEENRVNGNTDIGIVIMECSGNHIERNQVKDNWKGGIYCGGSANTSSNIIRGNTTAGNGNFGIKDCAYYTNIIENNIRSNGYACIILSDSYYCSITGNTVHSIQAECNTQNYNIAGNSPCNDAHWIGQPPQS